MEDSHSNDYRDLINERFNSVNSNMVTHFDSISNTLSEIKTQVLKTNGRISKAESDIKELQIDEAKHNAGYCPNGAYFSNKFEKIETAISEFKQKTNDDLADYHWFSKNKKLSLAIIVGAVLVVLSSYTGIMSYKQVNANTISNEQIHEQFKQYHESIKNLELEIQKMKK